MSAVFCKDFKQAGQRLVGLITVVPGKELMPVITRFLRGPAAHLANTVEIKRDISTGVKAYEWTVVVRLDGRSPADVIKEIIGDDFLGRHLPIADKSQMRRTRDAFLRIGSYINLGQHPCTSELFIINEMLTKNGDLLGERQWACTRAFDASNLLSELNTTRSDVYDNAADNRQVCEIVRKHRMDGGSWLLHPDYRPCKSTSNQTKQQCMDAFTRIVIEFLGGTLQDDYITRVNYATIKGVVKVTNEKTNYFEFVERGSPISAEDRFCTDTQVKAVYLKIANLQFQNARLKYKPEVFSVWKLNTENTRAFLSIYTSIPDERKKELASV